MNQYAATFTKAMNDVLGTILRFIPELVAAIIIFLIGLLVSSIIRDLVDKILHYTRFNQLSERLGLKEVEEQTHKQIDISRFIANLAYWLILLAFIDAAFGVMKVSAFNQFVNAIFAFIPNVIAALIILVIGFVGGTWLGDVVSGLESFARIGYKNILAVGLKWIIIIVAVMAALQQLNIATTIINILFTGLVGALSLGVALAIGLSYGLGGKDAAASSLSKMTTALAQMGNATPTQSNNQSMNRQKQRNR